MHFIHLNGPEIIDKAYGASEAHLRKAFDEAKQNAPAFVFIDEIDAIAPSRAEMSSDRQLERRVVAQPLALMDGVNTRGQVIVAAATTTPTGRPRSASRTARGARRSSRFTPAACPWAKGSRSAASPA